MADALWMYKLRNGLLGTPDSGGLLSPEQNRSAQNQGLMALGANLLAAGGPSRTPTSLGQALGPAILAGQQATQQSGQNSLQSMLLRQQLTAKNRVNPEKLGPGDMLVDPVTGKPIFTAPQKPITPQDPLSQLEADYRAKLISEPDYLARKKLLTTRQEPMSTNVTLNTEKSLYGTMADKIATQYSDQFATAQAAPEAIASSARVRQILKAIPYTGTGAEWKLAIGKAAKAAGLDYAGDDIANTELLAKELGQNVLNSVKSSGLAGSQGLTEGERKFLLQVVGGTITLDDKTLEKIADLNERVARNSIKKWNSTMKRLDQKQLKSLGVGPIEETSGEGGFGNGWGIVQ